MDVILAAGIGASLGALLNGFWHLQRWNLRPPMTYLLGVLTAAVPTGVAVGLASGNFSFLVTILAVFVPSGIVVWVQYWLDNR